MKLSGGRNRASGSVAVINIIYIIVYIESIFKTREVKQNRKPGTWFLNQ